MRKHTLHNTLNSNILVKLIAEDWLGLDEALVGA